MPVQYLLALQALPDTDAMDPWRLLGTWSPDSPLPNDLVFFLRMGAEQGGIIGLYVVISHSFAEKPS